MAETAAAVINDFLGHYREAASSGNVRELALLTTVEAELSAIFPIRTKTFEFEMDSTKREYPFTSDAQNIVKALAADLIRSSNPSDYRPLKHTPRAYLDKFRKGWRNTPAQEPYEYHIDATSSDGRALVLTSKPLTSAVGGYPKIQLTAQTRKTYAATTDALPESITNRDAYVVGMCALWSRRNRRDDYLKIWRDEWLIVLNNLRNYFVNFEAETNQRVLPGFIPPVIPM